MGAAPFAGGWCIYTVFCPTSPHICGPDEKFVQPPCPTQCVITYELKARSGIFYSCIPVGYTYSSSVPEQCYEWCWRLLIAWILLGAKCWFDHSSDREVKALGCKPAISQNTMGPHTGKQT